MSPAPLVHHYTIIEIAWLKKELSCILCCNMVGKYEYNFPSVPFSSWKMPRTSSSPPSPNLSHPLRSFFSDHLLQLATLTAISNCYQFTTSSSVRNFNPSVTHAMSHKTSNVLRNNPTALANTFSYFRATKFFPLLYLWILQRYIMSFSQFLNRYDDTRM